MELPQTSLDKLTAAFKALGDQAPSLLTKIGILRALFVDIESAKKDGYSYGVILETLIKSGLKATTPNQFYGLLNRIRLERGFTQSVAPPPASPGVVDHSRRSGDLAPKETAETKEVATAQQEQVKNDNPLISMGIGTSLKDEGNVPKTTLTFNKRNQVDKS